MARQRRREPRRETQHEEMIVFAPPGEPRLERRMRCNRSKLRLRTSLRRLLGPGEESR